MQPPAAKGCSEFGTQRGRGLAQLPIGKLFIYFLRLRAVAASVPRPITLGLRSRAKAAYR